MVDTGTGAMIPRAGVKLYLMLMGNPYAIDGSWVYIPKIYEAIPDSVGRAMFTGIPANTMLSPVGTYYELTYVVRDGSSLSAGQLFKFVVDTIPDPLNLINATRVW